MFEADLRTVRVSSIVEMPTELGNRCLLFQKLGLNAYWNTEEELMDALTKSIDDKTCLDVCLKSSRCQAFWELFQQGITPFNKKDPIRLSEYGGRYWVVEGKHRVCLAKRARVEKIDAYIWPLAEDVKSLLPLEGELGSYQFEHLIGIDGNLRINGETAILWVDSPHGLPPSRFAFSAAPLSVRQDTSGKLVEIFPGLKYRVVVKEVLKKVGIFQRQKFLSVRSEVIVEANHKKTRIWLLSGPAKEVLSSQPAPSIKTLYRFGCWRKHHKKLLSSMCFGV